MNQRETQENDGDVYNIIPIHNLLEDHPTLRFPEVRAAAAALRTVGELRKPPFCPWLEHYDILDWLALFFGFQSSNVKNQREHLVLHLANIQMRLSPDNIDTLDSKVVKKFRHRLLKNYSSWCAYLRVKSNIWPDSSSSDRRELLYVSLYLLIWGESANLRFMPECISYIFHNMAMELNKILEDFIDENTGRPFLPSISGENAYLQKVVKPIYDTITAEVGNSKNGTEPHSAWRNYDDINEYFWSKRCFEKLKWPLDLGSNFFVAGHKGIKVGKTGFVEQRSFWNLFRSFDKLWIMLILFLQAAIIVAWSETDFPWQALKKPEVQARCLTVFLTWSSLRLLQSFLDAGMQFRLVSRETKALGVRMVLKCMVAAAWILVFALFYRSIWVRNADGKQVPSNRRMVNFLEIVVVFLVPEILALALFVLPWIRNFLENTNWKIFFLMSWWFQNKIFVGRGLREGLMDNIKYSMFWIVVLATKFSFSYFMQIKPMIGPTKTLLRLEGVDYEWHQFFDDSNRFAVGLLWSPVVLIYLMDLQIWYAIYSSVVGAGVGLLDHLGEIRNIQQLTLRFQFFASALQFNLIPEEQFLNARSAPYKFLQDVYNRFKLRYGLGQPFKKLELNQPEAYKFALVWNEIISIFREEDIISDRELELLELPEQYSNDRKCNWEIRVIQWPCLLLCNELLLALSQAKELTDAPDQWLWHKIGKTEFRRCAVIESYDSLRNFLPAIVKQDSEEYSIIITFFRQIDEQIRLGKFSKNYKLTVLRKLHEKIVDLLNMVLKPDKNVDEVVNALQALYETAIRDFLIEKSSIDELTQLKRTSPDAGLLFENSVELPSVENETFYRKVRRLHTILTSQDAMLKVPKNIEARRRIAFFSNSLFMSMPHAPQVEKMMAFSVLTPYYEEEVLCSKELLRKVNEDGISTLYYLQTIYADDWQNFLERMRREGMVSEKEIWTKKLRDLRLWASYRSQTLARTVRGMMYYYRALEMLAFLDSASELDLREGSRQHGSTRGELSHSSRSLSPSRSSVGLLFKDHERGTVLMKYTYVIACQIYGSQKAKNDSRAEEILDLMRNNEALRVAYVDEVSSKRDGNSYYSVLVKFDQKLKREVEIYRVRLPGPVKLGEGKPENQNHAFIFTRGEAVQTIDMNQDNYFEEALKMRNLLEEFRSLYGIRKPTILGVREHIFTGSVSSLAWFMSAQEMSFVTLGQRVLANPLKVRMHYGHPDVFDRFWFLTRGGISKASRVINISEDIFAGFNCTLRGGNVTHHEYIQVGKGRDVGLNQISMFEAKVAGGNGEQVLSRDVYRLGHRLDFFRMLSFFFTTVGFYFNTMMLVLTVYAFLWGRLYLALSGIERSALAGNVDNNSALGTILNQQFIIQLGLFTALPMIVQSSLESGFLNAIWDFITMQLQFSSVFYTFSMGTRGHYFGRTILHGGAKYRATGRGFVVVHKSFAENYRLYARSHFVKAIELGVILTVYASYSHVATSTFVYIALTISSWFLVVSWILGPFIFNPSGFDWLKTVYDFDDFMTWIWYEGSEFSKPEQSWENWWIDEQDHLRKTGLWGKIFEVILDLRFFFFQYGIVYQLSISDNSDNILVYLLSWVYVFLILGLYMIIAHSRVKYDAKSHIYFRLVQLLVIILAALVLVLLLHFTEFKFVDFFTSLLAFIPTGWGFILIAQVMRPYLEKRVFMWDLVVSVARLYEFMFGVIVMAPVAILSWLPGFQNMQTKILFNQAFSRGLHISQIVSGKKRKTDDYDDDH